VLLNSYYVKEDPLILRSILLALIILTFQSCTYRVITDYEDCISEKLLFELKDDKNLFIIDDSRGTYKYSSMNFPKNEYFVCISEKNGCIKEHSGYYQEGWKIIPVSSKSFHLTGKYKINKPNVILGAFASEYSALQIDINGTKAWIAVYELYDASNFKKSSQDSIIRLNKNRKLTTDWYDMMGAFECPNPNVKESDWKIIWFK
jgi:hypothetical protein